VVEVPPGARIAKIGFSHGSTKAHGLELLAFIRDSSLQPNCKKIKVQTRGTSKKKQIITWWNVKGTRDELSIRIGGGIISASVNTTKYVAPWRMTSNRMK